MTIAGALLGRPTAHALAWLRAWPVDSQQRARRNAMIAATACAQRRAERQDVAEFLAAKDAPVVLDPLVERRAHG